MKRDFPPIHPGEILREEFLAPLRLTAYQLARRTGLSQTRLSQILKEKRGITAETALRLSRHFAVSAEFWMGLQAQYELEVAAERLVHGAVEVLRQAFGTPRPPSDLPDHERNLAMARAALGEATFTAVRLSPRRWKRMSCRPRPNDLEGGARRCSNPRKSPPHPIPPLPARK